MMSTQAIDETVASAAIEDRPSPPRCPPPARIEHEVRLYDAAAEVCEWHGSRYRMTYRVLGQGPTLIWLPGIASTYRVYALVLNRLAAKFRTIQYAYPGDEPGDGRALGRISHDHLVDDLLGLIDHLRLDSVFLAGISFGSTIALKALARQSQRFPRAVVQGAFAHRRFTPAERIALFLGRRFPGTAAGLPLRERVLTYNSKMEFPRVIEDRWPFYLEQNGLTPIRALAHRSSLLARLDLRPMLAKVDADLLLVQGREDRIVPHRHLEELKALLPRSESTIMPTVGHIPHLTHAESLAHLIGDWLLPCKPEVCAGAGQAGEAGGCPSSGTEDCPLSALAARTAREPEDRGGAETSPG